MGVGAGFYMYVVVVQKFTFAISSPDEFLLFNWPAGFEKLPYFDTHTVHDIIDLTERRGVGVFALHTAAPYRPNVGPRVNCSHVQRLLGLLVLLDHCVVIVALWNRAATITFSCCYLFFFLLFFPRLISAAGAAADWMSAILPRLVWP